MQLWAHKCKVPKKIRSVLEVRHYACCYPTTVPPHPPPPREKKKNTVATLPTLMWPLKLNMKMHWTCPPDLFPIISQSPINIQDSHVLPPLCDSCIQNIGMTTDESPGLLHTTQWAVYWNLENILSLRLLQTIFNNLGGLIRLPFSLELSQLPFHLGIKQETWNKCVYTQYYLTNYANTLFVLQLWGLS